MWKIIGTTLLFIGLGVLVATQYIHKVVVEYYSPGFVTESIAEARTRGVFISQPSLKNKVIGWGKSEYPIREAWIEQATRIQYDWLFFRRVIPTGNRLVLVIGRIGKPPKEDFVYFRGGKEAIVCNNSIWVSTTQPATPTPNENLMYSEFSSAVPTSIQCVVKKLN